MVARMKVHRFTPSKFDYDLCKICYEPSDAHPDDDELDVLATRALPADLRQRDASFTA